MRIFRKAPSDSIDEHNTVASIYDIRTYSAMSQHPKHSWIRYLLLSGTTALVLLLLIVGWHSLGQKSKKISTPKHNLHSATAINGWIHTSGTSLIDASGKKVILAGVDDAGMNFGQGNTPDSCNFMWSASSSSAVSNMRSMGFNMDRIALSWANLEPTAPTVNPNGTLTHHWNMEYLAALDKEIAYLHANHMVAILDMHQGNWTPAFKGKNCEGKGLPTWLYTTDVNSINRLGVAQCQFFTDIKETDVPEKPQEGLAAVWAMLARRYSANSTVVGADMFNEPNWPSSCKGANLTTFYDKIGNAIRSVNKHILLIYEDKGYYTYKATQAFLLESKPALTNALYSWHFYPVNWSAGKPSLEAHLARAKSWDVPFWIGEFDAFGGSYSNPNIKPPLDPNWQTDLMSQMQYFKQNNINWSIWDYNTGGYSVLIPGTNKPKKELLSLLQQDMSQ